MRQIRHAGYSLLELVIAIGVMAILISQVMMVFTTQHRSYLQQGRVSDTQQDLRLLTDAILGDLRMAGFMVAIENSVGSIDGGNAGSDILCMSDPSAFAVAQYTNATDRFDASELTTTITGSVTSVSILSSDMDVDGDGTADFAAGGGILISDGVNVHCGRITNVAGTTVTFTPATSGVSMSPLTTSAVPAIVYELNGSALLRNGTILSTQVDDLQVEFWVDTDGDRIMEAGEFPLDDLAGQDLSRVRLARIYLTTRSAVPDAGFAGQRAAAANRVAGATDNFRRRRAIADSRLRNAS